METLERAGELDDTLLIVTADNGMAFPRAKANLYEFGTHMPLAIRWPGAGGKPGREARDLVQFVDITATICDAAGVAHPGGASRLAGRSIRNILEADREGMVDASRDRAFSGRERHSSSRWNNYTYPQRSLRTPQYLYIRNFKPERWPAGAPQKYEADGKTLGPMHGGYHDIDGSPSLTFLSENRGGADIGKYFHLAVDKRPAEELFDVEADPGCLRNLAAEPEYEETRAALWGELEAYLKETGDPRVTGNGDIWEEYIRYSPIRKFPAPAADSE